MSAEGPDKTVNGERTLWNLTHSRQWTVANTRELDSVAEAWIREHEENNRFDLTRGLPWHVKRDQRVAFLGERIKALFRDEAQFRVGTVNRRIQELVNRLTNGWVLGKQPEESLEYLLQERPWPMPEGSPKPLPAYPRECSTSNYLLCCVWNPPMCIDPRPIIDR